FELASVVDEVVALLRPRAEQKGLTLARTLPAALPGRLLGDPHRLRQVLTNLVGNAVKFTERGGVTLGIALLDQAACRARVRITVTDTGIGIPRDRHAAIFDSFTQADGSTTRRYGGTGLGLTISRQLVELMGGRIGVESAPGQGSTFWVELVFETPPTERRGPPPAARSPTPAARARGLRVLVADDDPVSRRIALEMLGRLGCEADGVPGGAGVLAALARARYDVAFVDVQMPDLDGFAVTAAVRRQEAGTRRRLPIVAMTAHAMEEDRERCLTAGMDGYVRKPIRLEDVATALDGLATASASAREASPIADVARADGRAELLGRPS